MRKRSINIGLHSLPAMKKIMTMKRWSDQNLRILIRIEKKKDKDAQEEARINIGLYSLPAMMSSYFKHRVACQNHFASLQ